MAAMLQNAVGGWANTGSSTDKNLQVPQQNMPMHQLGLASFCEICIRM